MSKDTILQLPPMSPSGQLICETCTEFSLERHSHLTTRAVSQCLVTADFLREEQRKTPADLSINCLKPLSASSIADFDHWSVPKFKSWEFPLPHPHIQLSYWRSFSCDSHHSSVSCPNRLQGPVTPWSPSFCSAQSSQHRSNWCSFQTRYTQRLSAVSWQESAAQEW